MKVDAVLKVRDVPGVLVSALEPISRHGGNIISVTHSRAERNYVSVYIGFKVKDESSLDQIKKELKKAKILISSISIEGRAYYVKKSFSVILIGHVIDTDIRDTLDRINSIGMVASIDVVMPAPDKKSSVLLDIEADEKCYGQVIRMLEEISKEKGFLLIRSL